MEENSIILIIFNTDYIFLFKKRNCFLSGIGAGSVYCSGIAIKAGFPYECFKHRVIVIKTHILYRKRDIYDKAVVVLRNPFDVLLSAFDYFKTAGPYGRASMEAYEGEFDITFDPLFWL